MGYTILYRLEHVDMCSCVFILIVHTNCLRRSIFLWIQILYKRVLGHFKYTQKALQKLFESIIYIYHLVIQHSHGKIHHFK